LPAERNRQIRLLILANQVSIWRIYNDEKKRTFLHRVERPVRSTCRLLSQQRQAGKTTLALEGRWPLTSADSTSVLRGFHAACADLRPARRFVVYPGSDAIPFQGEVEALLPATLMNRLTEMAGHQ